jgi:hypothetical protein
MRRYLHPAILVLAVLLAACGEEEPTAQPETPLATATAETSPEFTPAEPEQGGTYWGVYVAIADKGDDAALQQSAEALDALGYSEYSIGDISCDEGAAEELGVPEDSGRVAVYFETEEEARAFSGSLPSAIVRIAEVKTFCLD